MSNPPTLLLVPTVLERKRLLECWPGGAPPCAVELCGFGLAAAAARTAQLIARERPARVVLAGIAGSYDLDVLPLGVAAVPAWVASDGIGVGEGEGFLKPAAAGFPQWPGDATTPEIFDSLELDGAAGDSDGIGLLSVAASAAEEASAERRRRGYPGVLLEDMEGFGVALAARLAGVEVTVVRGVSNAAGDRDTGRWTIDAALARVAERLAVIVGASR